MQSVSRLGVATADEPTRSKSKKPLAMPLECVGVQTRRGAVGADSGQLERRDRFPKTCTDGAS